jgi:hypothetical protein
VCQYPSGVFDLLDARLQEFAKATSFVDTLLDETGEDFFQILSEEVIPVTQKVSKARLCVGVVYPLTSDPATQ